MINPYSTLSLRVGTVEASSLGARLSAWHDAMVAHERRRRTVSADTCHDDCPHVEARRLWSEALDVFGDEAHDLAFLRAHGRLQDAP